jgi:hypothetical protein
MEVWSEWYGTASIFAKLLIKYLSRKMNQLNIPLSALETSRGMSSEVIRLVGNDRQVAYTCWLRKSVKSERVVYAGFYTTCYIPELKRHFVKTVFPLPNGNATVVLRAEVQDDGSLKLISAGSKVGEDGYYRVRYSTADKAKARYIPIKEEIHVYRDGEGCLRTDHRFRFWGMRLLHLHYKITEK